MIFELAVIIPFAVLGIVAPVFLLITRAVLRVVFSVLHAVEGMQERRKMSRMFAPYVRRGFY